jgi:hypothetical protein
VAVACFPEQRLRRRHRLVDQGYGTEPAGADDAAQSLRLGASFRDRPAYDRRRTALIARRESLQGDQGDDRRYRRPGGCHHSGDALDLGKLKLVIEPSAAVPLGLLLEENCPSEAFASV